MTSVEEVCGNCGAAGTAETLRRCTQCKYAYYCNPGCQATHWRVHKKQCKFWINMRPHTCYVCDEDVKKKSIIQERDFLSSSSGMPPAIGQRVDLHCGVNGRSFMMSGQVVQLLPRSVPLRPVFHTNSCDKQDPDMSYNLMDILNSDSDIINQFKELLEQVLEAYGEEAEVKCPCKSKRCYGNAIMLAWEQSSPEFKQLCMDALIKKFGTHHGQQVVVQARLHFDDDERRSSAEGPWKDGILVDGRDIWEFTLQADDAMRNQWMGRLETFRNLGREAQPRCWPWSLEKTLPYSYQSGDIQRETIGPLYRTGCLGAFGCYSAGHSHGAPIVGVDEEGAPLPPDFSGAA